MFSVIRVVLSVKVAARMTLVAFRIRESTWTFFWKMIWKWLALAMASGLRALDDIRTAKMMKIFIIEWAILKFAECLVVFNWCLELTEVVLLFLFFGLFELVGFGRHELKRRLIQYVFSKLWYLDRRLGLHLMLLILTSRWLLNLTFVFGVAFQVVLHCRIDITILVGLNAADGAGNFVVWAMYFFLDDWIFAEEWYLRLLTLLFLNGVRRVWPFLIFFD